MIRIILVHRWAGNAHEPLYQWLKAECEKRGYTFIIPHMPDPHVPRIDAWVEHLHQTVGTLDKDTYFIGHSIGCQTIMRYLETQKTACGGVLFIAGWCTLQGLETEEEFSIAQPWLETPLDFEAIKDHMGKLTCIFSDNDAFVPLSDKEIFKAKLDAHIVVEHAKGHYTEEDGIHVSDSALKELLNLILK